MLTQGESNGSRLDDELQDMMVQLCDNMVADIRHTHRSLNITVHAFASDTGNITEGTMWSAKFPQWLLSILTRDFPNS